MNFSESLIKWYRINKRDLPWRRTKDPYKIWVSEIILQQTRVNQGWDYYIRFLKKFPTIESLAYSTEQEVLMEWQGLGYYSRARNMHRTSKLIMAEFNGVFPSDYPSILSLPGIGDYTAAAISSIAFNGVYPVMDGNVLRVISRIFGIHDPIDGARGKTIIKNILYDLIDDKYPSDFNQGMMELGALICKPASPECSKCTFNDRCHAFNTNEIKILPVKSKKVKTKNRYFHYFVVEFDKENKTKILLKERTGKDIWKGLNDFPLYELPKKATQLQIKNWLDSNLDKLDFTLNEISEEYKHILSHQTIHARFYFVQITGIIEPVENWILNNKYNAVEIENLSKIPYPKLIENLIRKKFLS